MSYLVLARKYRPQKFEDIIGQEHITRVLKNAIKENRVAHGYIFSGQRGVGKTTTARIFAKALNCKSGPAEEPCNKCRNCEEIIRGNSIDVIEIDGASNRGIDEIRNLRENIKYAPAASKYKIYIIDEAHQITDAAFNALLKTLEEPPEHCIFIMATTDPQKFPDTILSRCQRFNFRPVSIKDISGNIMNIAKKENISVDEKAVNLIARSAGGSLRDSLSIFDQIISFCGNKIGIDDIISVLGMLKEDTLTLMTEQILKNNTERMVSAVRDTISAGYDPVSIAADLQSYLRNILLNKTAPGIITDTSDREKLDFYSKNFSADVILRLIDLLSDCVYQMKNTEQPALVLDVFCVKLTQKYVGLDEIVNRLEMIEGGGGHDSDDAGNSGDDDTGENRTEAKKTGAAAGRERPGSGYPAETGRQTKQPSGPAQKPRNISPAQNFSSVSPANLAGMWKSIIENNKENPVLASCMADSRLIGFDGTTATIEFKNSFTMDVVESNKNIWLGMLEEKLGKKINIKETIAANTPGGETPPPDSDEPAIEEENEEEIIAPNGDGAGEMPELPKHKPGHAAGVNNPKNEEPIAKTIIDLFGGTIEKND